MNLYYVRWDNESGENRDTLVEADSEEEALKLWQQWAVEAEENQQPYYIGLVTLIGKPRVIGWETIIPDENNLPGDLA